MVAILKSLRFCLVALLLVSAACSVSPRATSVILISADAFRWDYPEKATTPNIDYLIAHGARAKSLIPCFPTKTFPNHYTIVTGLYPDHHGIVANNMVDPKTQKKFSLGNETAIHDPAWWGGEPIWVTAEKQHVKTATYFWPGSETRIHGALPTYSAHYDGKIPNEARVAQLLDWLDLPAGQRPRFLTCYFSLLDDVGHHHDPDAPEVSAAITRLDSLVGKLLDGLRQRDLLSSTDILLVSDHGMAATSRQRVIFLDDYLDPSQVQVVDWNPVAAINPAKMTAGAIYAALEHASPHLSVYGKEELPARYHYGKNARVPEIIAIADEGWSISTRDYFQKRARQFDGATHGYDNALPSMGAICIASGPDFKNHVTVPAFSNIHLYELMAHLLRVEPAPNDGSLDSVRVMLRN